MMKSRLSLIAALSVAALGAQYETSHAGAGTAYELEHARANARAGGPISEYDAELLERWGNSTGGPDWRKTYRAQQGDRDRPARSDRNRKSNRAYQN